MISIAEAHHGHHALLPSRVWLCLGLLVAILWLFQKAKGLLWVFSALVLPGTFCHECCHYLSGLALNGRPVGFSVLPRRDGGGIQLGAVRLENLRWYNVFFIGMAPLAMLPAGWVLFTWILAQGLPMGVPLVLWLFLVANLAYGGIPSGVDLRMAARSPVGWVLLGALLLFGWNRFRNPVHGLDLRPVQAALQGRRRPPPVPPEVRAFWADTRAFCAHAATRARRSAHILRDRLARAFPD